MLDFCLNFKKILIDPEQIQNRIKPVAGDKYIQNDLLANIFKPHRNLNNSSLLPI